METLRIIAQEQQSICLVALGLLSLAVAFSFRRFFPAGKAAIGMRQAFWLSQAVLGSSGVAVLVWPSLGWAAITAAVIGCGLLILKLDRSNAAAQAA